MNSNAVPGSTSRNSGRILVRSELAAIWQQAVDTQFRETTSNLSVVGNACEIRNERLPNSSEKRHVGGKGEII